VCSLQAQLNACRSQLNSESESRERRPAYRQAQQLEELRNLQDRLTHEKEAWAKEREDQEKELSERRAELTRLQASTSNIAAFTFIVGHKY